MSDLFTDTNTQAIPTSFFKNKSIGTPNAVYESLREVYRNNRAVLSGESYVKALDTAPSYNNLLKPFSDVMTQEQYDIYKAEAELPAWVEQYARTLVSGLLRKEPQIRLPESMPEEQHNEVMTWLESTFGQYDESLLTFLDSALWEELNNSRAFVLLTYPNLDRQLERGETLEPYPILLKGESIINWRTDVDRRTGKLVLTSVVIYSEEAEYTDENPWHPNYIPTVYWHYLDGDGYYVVEKHQNRTGYEKSIAIAGQIQQLPSVNTDDWTLVARDDDIRFGNQRMDFLPVYPLNGHIEPIEPILTNLITKELHQYQRLSGRNHLQNGTRAYTVLVKSDQIKAKDQEQFKRQGLGSIWFLNSDDDADVLAPPHEALAEFYKSIEASYEEMSNLGMRLMSPEVRSHVSGVAINLQQGASVSILASLNTRISETMRNIIASMVNWRYGTDYAIGDFSFSLSSDFTAGPIGIEGVRLIGEWYLRGMVDADAWIYAAKKNDLLPSDWDVVAARENLKTDEIFIDLMTRREEAIEGNRDDNNDDRADVTSNDNNEE